VSSRIRTAKALLALAESIMAEDGRRPSRRRRADQLGVIGDAFARYLIGDREVALRQLKSLANKPFEGDVSPLHARGEYNKLYGDLATELTRIIKKHLPV